MWCMQCWCCGAGCAAAGSSGVAPHCAAAAAASGGGNHHKRTRLAAGRRCSMCTRQCTKRTTCHGVTGGVFTAVRAAAPSRMRARTAAAGIHRGQSRTSITVQARAHRRGAKCLLAARTGKRTDTGTVTRAVDTVARTARGMRMVQRQSKARWQSWTVHWKLLALEMSCMCTLRACGRSAVAALMRDGITTRAVCTDTQAHTFLGSTSMTLVAASEVLLTPLLRTKPPTSMYTRANIVITWAMPRMDKQLVANKRIVKCLRWRRQLKRQGGRAAGTAAQVIASSDGSVPRCDWLHDQGSHCRMFDDYYRPSRLDSLSTCLPMASMPTQHAAGQ